ncbi:hypothetical protein [Bacillus cereus]|uniref:Uncharacterized protein n=1 Tax=Bacillus cereus TaxID=1396 RepID=A0AA44Q5V3_BACCE|nr:hypothetical protein [Bacillus cereus]PFN04230.1 hypothetical protein COJ55_22405 [Bacillus cereus]PFR89373.1 hypothetical protein COK38_24555 [Bacillus cereus]
MDIDELYCIGPSYIFPVPEWFKFFSSLGAYLITNPGTKHHKTHIAVSLPGTDFVPLVTAAGMSDTIFNRRLLKQTIVDRITSLTEGQTIFLTRENKREIYTFKDIITHPVPIFENERCARLVSKGMTTIIPERSWSQLQIASTDQQYKRKQLKGFGFGSPFLKELYGKEKLLNAASEYTTDFYIIGNNAKILELSSAETLSYRALKGTFADLLCFKGKQSAYYHSVIISNVGKGTNEEELEPNVPIIFTDALSYLNKAHLSSKNPSIIFLNRTDTGDRNNEVVLDVKRRILENETEIIIESVIDSLGGMEKCPNGIELLAWREK